MGSTPNQYDNKMESQILVFSACALEREVEWVEGGCSIENSILSSKISKFASTLKKYVDTLKLGPIQVVDSFNPDGSAWVKVFIFLPTFDVKEIESKLTATQSVIQKSMENHWQVIQKLSTQTNFSELNNCGGSAAVEAFLKCLSNKIDSKVRFDFPNLGTKFINTIQPLVLKIQSESKKSVATGNVKYFNDGDQKVILFNLENIAGEISLSVSESQHRDVLIKAQLEKRQIGVKYMEMVDLIRPDIVSRDGRLIEIERIGRSQMEIKM